MKYPTDPRDRDAVRAHTLRAYIERDEMTLNELEYHDQSDHRVRTAKRLAKRRIARNARELKTL